MATPYKVGYCIQCHTQIMVRDTSGVYTSIKGNFRQVNLVFSDGHNIRVPICSKCLNQIDYDKCFENLIHEDSQASKSKTVMDTIRKNKDGTDRIKPDSHKEIKMKFEKGGNNGNQ